MTYHRMQAVGSFGYQLLHKGRSLASDACGVVQEFIGWKKGGKRRMPKDRVKQSSRKNARECSLNCSQGLEEAIVRAS